MNVSYDPLKRSFDVIISLLAIALTLPLQAIIAVIIAVKLGRPVLFRQDRPGKDGKKFVLVKFRTMKSPEHGGVILSDADRMTPLGRKLRETSLDELPTLWNVLRGDMSLVGPRPLLMGYLNRYTPEQARRHEVRPGVTGLAQVSGRNALTWEERFHFDVDYVDRRSFALDLNILFRTLIAVLRRDGISAEGHVTMPEFQGGGKQRD